MQLSCKKVMFVSNVSYCSRLQLLFYYDFLWNVSCHFLSFLWLDFIAIVLKITFCFDPVNLFVFGYQLHLCLIFSWNAKGPTRILFIYVKIVYWFAINLLSIKHFLAFLWKRLFKAMLTFCFSLMFLLDRYQ